MKLSQKLKKRIIIIGVGSAVALSLTLFLGIRYEVAIVSAAADAITYPFKKGIHFVQQGVGNVTSYFKDLEALLAENDSLVIENERLLYENTILNQYKSENDQLKALLEMEQRYADYPSQGANVVAKEPGNWYKVFNVDKGKIAGIQIDDVVLADGGLVGHVYQADPFSSQVLSIIDDRSAVGAQVVRTDAIGILKGDIELGDLGLCKMELSSEAEIVKGDQIITSHLSDIYPPGIPIGVVEEVVSEPNGLIQYAYVKTFANFKHLQNVLILDKEQGE